MTAYRGFLDACIGGVKATDLLLDELPDDALKDVLTDHRRRLVVLLDSTFEVVNAT